MSAKKKILITTLGILVVAFGWVAFRIYESTGLRFIQKTSGVTFPRGISKASVYDSGAFYVTAHVTIPKDALEDFVARYKFSAHSSGFASVMGVEQLEPEFRQIPATADHRLAGRSSNNRWVFVLDRSSGDLWATVLYPDWAGDSP